jgi:hypothetical protein
MSLGNAAGYALAVEASTGLLARSRRLASGDVQLRGSTGSYYGRLHETGGCSVLVPIAHNLPQCSPGVPTVNFPILLFFRDSEFDKLVLYDRYLKRIVRPLYSRLLRRPKQTGFATWFRLLCDALQRAGANIAINNYRLARARPELPVGLVGAPPLLESWSLSNPALLGPALYDHPGLAPHLMADPRFRRYLVSADWCLEMFRPYYGEHCALWFAGIDVAHWPDSRQGERDIDVLVYDKIRWDRERLVPGFLEPLVAELRRGGLSVQRLQYRFYDVPTYRRLLGRSRSMLFLCEHETQGIAYQEALASNVPVLAWDNGFWLDPLARRFSSQPIPASSVPYFDTRCGERFRDLASFSAVFELFWARLGSYEPRQYVKEHLSPAASSSLYLQLYRELLPDRGSLPSATPGS